MRAQFKPDDRQFKVCDKIRVNPHPGEIEDAVVKMSATPRSRAYTISSATPPREYSDFEARILVRVADTSPRSNQEGATGNGANRANAMMMTYKTPAILALTRGDLSTVPFAIFGSLCGIVNSTLRDDGLATNRSSSLMPSGTVCKLPCKYWSAMGLLLRFFLGLFLLFFGPGRDDSVLAGVSN